MLLCASREDACDLLFVLTLTGARLAIFGSQSARVVRGGDLLWDTFPPKAADLRMPGNGERCRRGNAKTVTLGDSHHRGRAAVLETEAGLKSR
jgi:hypothetical protein